MIPKRVLLVTFLVCACSEAPLAPVDQGSEEDASAPNDPRPDGGCGAALITCGGSCVDPARDPLHCGGCEPCAPADGGVATCTAGLCGVGCPSGRHLCGGTCATDDDPGACGAGCVACGGGDHAQPACRIGQCALACEAGWGDCDGAAGNGCEHALVDSKNCGGCGVVCPVSAPVCDAGTCVPLRAASVALGTRHGCALTPSGAVACWGAFTFARASVPPADRATPAIVEGLEPVNVALVAGGSWTCALGSSGAVRCWGSGVQPFNSMTPKEVMGFTGPVVALGAGSAFDTACGALMGGGLQCFGNNYGTVGDGTENNVRAMATPVSGLAGRVKGAGVGEGFACAILEAGGAKCWGTFNDVGQLGHDLTSDSLTPVDVVGLDGVALRSIHLGRKFACVLTEAGGVKCWGQTPHGVLVRHAEDVPGISGVAQLAAGEGHLCARFTDGATRCWGRNDSGMLGDRTNLRSLTPVDVRDVTGVQSLAASGVATCAVVTGGGVRCWGGNPDGLLGDESPSPGVLVWPQAVDPVGASSGFAEVAAGDQFTCARTTGGAVSCWGANDRNQLGDGGSARSLTPKPVSGLAGVTRLRAGRWSACALLGDSTVSCWGELRFANRVPTPTPVAGLSNVLDLRCGTTACCALVQGGGVKCWGSGPLGASGTSDSASAVDVAGLGSGVTAVDVGGGHACALLGGAAKCWGTNDSGELGDGTTLASKTPVDVPGLAGLKDLALGAQTTLVITAGDTVKMWGNRPTGTGALGGIVDLAGVSGVSSLVFGSWSGCAFTSGGVTCFGENTSAALGTGDTVATATSPLAVVGAPSSLAHSEHTSSGTSHACAVVAGGALKCWGSNSGGQLGVAVQARPPFHVRSFP